ncbi:MAG: hypothetical protein ACXAEX_16180 [Promethearchaeota archaeon]
MSCLNYHGSATMMEFHRTNSLIVIRVAAPRWGAIQVPRINDNR